MNRLANCLLFTILVACGDYSKKISQVATPTEQNVSAISTTSFSVDRMAGQIHYQVISKNLNEMSTFISSLEQDITTLCATPSESNLSSARSTWWQVMQRFHRIEIAAVGPLAENEMDNLKQLYSWPEVNSCIIDVEIATMAKDPGKFQLKDSINRRTLSAIEYLLYTNKDHSCPNPNATLKNWLTKDISSRKKDQCSYMALVAKKIADDRNHLMLKWKYYEQSLLSSEIFVQEISNSLFLTDTLIKDRKVGLPTGIQTTCAKKSCPDQVEHPWSGKSTDAIKENFIGFKQIVYGDQEQKNGRLGLYGLIAFNGQPSVGTQLLTKIDTIISIVQTQQQNGSKNFDAIIVEMGETTCNENADQFACHLYDAIKNLTDFMKVDLLSALSLRLSHHAAGDND